MGDFDCEDFIQGDWSPAVKAIYDKAMARTSMTAMHFGPAHIVWEDGNYDSAEWCLKNFHKYCRDFTPGELDVLADQSPPEEAPTTQAAAPTEPQP